jgi:hypothetical protein
MIFTYNEAGINPASLKGENKYLYITHDA